MQNHRLTSTLLAAVMLAGGLFGLAAQPAKADATSTAVIVGAAAIVGALLIDSNNRPYYVNSGRRYYVTQNEAGYWRAHHRVVQRRAWVPEQEYPVARNPYGNRR